MQRHEIEIFEAPAGFGQSGVRGRAADEGDQDLSNLGAVHREPVFSGLELLRRGLGPSRPAGGRENDVRVTAVEPAPELRG